MNFAKFIRIPFLQNNTARHLFLEVEVDLLFRVMFEILLKAVLPISTLAKLTKRERDHMLGIVFLPNK